MILNPEAVGTNGNKFSENLFSENLFSYTGHVYEESTGLYYAKARYYDAKIGRFISEDSYRGEQGESTSLNLYAYVQNNPVKYSDPSGNIAIPLFGAAVVIILIIGTHAISTYERYIHSPEGKDAINRGATAIKDGVVVAGKLQAAGTVWLGKKYVEYNLKFVDKAKDIISSLFGIKPKTSPNYFTLSNVDQTTFILQSKGNVDSKEEKTVQPDSAGKMQREVEKGQAPREVDRVDDAHVGGKPHVHFKNGTAMNNDGTTHDKKGGEPDPSNKTKKWLKEHGWKVD